MTKTLARAARIAAPGSGLAALLLAAGAALAQTDTPAPAPTAEAPAVLPAEGFAAETVIATVNGQPVTLGELIALRRDLPAQYQDLPDEVLSNGLTEQLIDQTLLEQAARAEGFADRPAIRLSIQNQVRAVLADAYLSDIVDRRVTEEAIAAAYAARYADAAPVEEVRAAHILVPTEEAAAKLKAELDGGADFAALAAEHGTDATASRGGELGWFVHADMVPQFADAAFALAAGQISAPVQSPFGWHLIKLEERRQKAAPALAEVADQLAEELTRTAQTELLAGLRANGALERPTTPPPPDAIRADQLIAN